MLKKTKIIIVVGLLLSLNVTLNAQNMSKPFLLKSGDEIIDYKPPYAGPCCFDYDNDGLQDLIVGTFQGEFRFYKNMGTKEKPTYNNFSLIQAEGKDAKVHNW